MAAEAASIKPLPLQGFSRVRSFGAGADGACAILEPGELLCTSKAPELPPGAQLLAVLVPVQVADLSEVDDITAGNAHTCALRQGEVYCWGSNQVGQLGSGAPKMQTRPALVPDLEGITVIAAGSGHQCAATEDGSVWCWGNSFFGQAGGVAGQNVLRPQRVMQR